MALSIPAFAADDTPLAKLQGSQPDNTPLVTFVPLDKGQPAPADGCFADTNSCIASARQRAALQYQSDQFSKRPDWWVVAVVGAAGILLGGAATYAILKK